NRIKGTLSDTLPSEPVVLNKAQHGALISHGVIDEVVFRVWSGDQEWLARAISATALRVWPCDAIQQWRCLTAVASPVQPVRRSLGLVHDLAELMIVPSVRIVIHDDHSRVRPFPLSLQEVDEMNHKPLLIKRIRITGVSILVCRALNEIDGWK